VRDGSLDPPSTCRTCTSAAAGCILLVMGNPTRIALGVVLLVVALVALAVTLQPYGSYLRTDFAGGPGTLAGIPTECPSVVHGVPKNGYGVRGPSGCHPGGPIREALAVTEGIGFLLGLGLLVTAARRRQAATAPSSAGTARSVNLRMREEGTRRRP
jgi:hypothetical protein